MALNTKISWAHHSANPWIGCQKVSPGCKFCYMFRDQARWGKDGSVVRKAGTSGWKAVFKKALPGERIFMCSMSDFWHEDGDPWREEVYEAMRNRPDLIYLIPTKRPENIESRLPKDWGIGWPNVWLGFSAEDQYWFNRRYAIMSQIRCYVLWVSAEPLLEGINMTNAVINGKEVNALTGDKDHRMIDWAVLGGESGNDTGAYKYRECHTEWLINMVDQCKAHGASIFMKQMGTYLYKVLKLTDRAGAKIEEFPEHLQLQEFPEVVEFKWIDKEEQDARFPDKPWLTQEDATNLDKMKEEFNRKHWKL